jgi:hypothetical protein
MGLERVHFQLFFRLHTHFMQKLTCKQCIGMTVDTAAGGTRIGAMPSSYGVVQCARL